ncbi:hypothetical protein SODALDRAFT_320906 [Sodiomyces alkalinus F11]|uniref:Uncharacterized protein n=1 Tax=Sodiomyces alkalinus (strain CBS 110278 / VKM F-3762 / F11) TaxID=1314773 RepID=A0A3N2PM53_SODAK|nr:hypothetical protein SODALDRAFT_320906 [Sodiomyces alkalinus F11]ROT35611.1 hypothetical protein SODALDRAFT_320906 [Sodiomyces alkalinus F11]
METLRCQCVSCNSDLASFVNLWVQIGKGYCSPVIEAENIKLDPKGPQRGGESGTLVADCLLQDLVCIKCQSNVGLKCVTSPVNHVLHEARKESELNIQRSLKLRQPVTSEPQQATSSDDRTPGDRPRASAAENGVHCQGSYASVSATPLGLERLQADLETQRADIDRIDTAAYQVVSSFDNSMSRIDREMQMLNDTVRDLRRDLEANKHELRPLKAGLSAVEANVSDKSALAKLESQLEMTNAAVSAMRKLATSAKTATHHLQADLQGSNREMRTLQTETSSLRQELNAAKKNAKDALAASKEQERQFSVLQSELGQMREAMAQDRARRPEPPKSDYPTNELEIITANVSKIGREAGQISSLQMEFDLFKSRMRRLEGRVSVCEAKDVNETQRGMDVGDGRQPAGAANAGDDDDDHAQSWFPQEGARKRRAAGVRDPGTTGADIETPPKQKRVAHPRDDVRPDTASSPIDVPLPHASSGRNRTVSAVTSSSSRQVNSRRQTMAGVQGRSAVKRKSRGGDDALDAIYTPPGD